MFELPARLLDSVEQLISKCDAKELGTAAKDLSDRYRGTSPSRTFIGTEVERLAYLLTRFPATYASVGAAMTELSHAVEPENFRSILDLGAGPGTAVWAAGAVFPGLESATLWERDPGMITIGRELAQGFASNLSDSIEWKNADLGGLGRFPRHGLVVMAYSFGELDGPKLRRKVLEKAWDAAEGAFLLVEPGTPKGFENIREAREWLIRQGARIACPCPHDNPCPVSGTDWCHFAQRLPRTRLHRTHKGGELSYEDEKYSYVAAVRRMEGNRAARIVRHPQKRPGHVILELCTRDGLQQSTIGKREKTVYKSARKAAWGETWGDDE